jgi:hypothetical protein
VPLADSRHRGPARFAVSPSRPPTVPKQDGPTRCVAASCNRSVGSCPVCLDGTCTRLCPPQTWPFPVRRLLRTAGLPVRWPLRLSPLPPCSGRSPNRASRGPHKCVPREALRSSAFPLPGTSCCDALLALLRSLHRRIAHAAESLARGTPGLRFTFVLRIPTGYGQGRRRLHPLLFRCHPRDALKTSTLACRECAPVNRAAQAELRRVL